MFASSSNDPRTNVPDTAHFHPKATPPISLGGTIEALLILHHPTTATTTPTTTTTTFPTAPANASAPSDRAGSLSSEIIDLGEDSEETIMHPWSQSSCLNRCAVHQEPAKEFRVNKRGPHKGRNERRREEVDHQYKYNFFMLGQ